MRTTPPQPGDEMQFRGPVTTLEYSANTAKCLGMIAGPRSLSHFALCLALHM